MLLLFTRAQLNDFGIDFAHRVQFRNEFRAEGKGAAGRTPEQLSFRADLFIWQVVHLVDSYAADRHGRRTEQRQFHAIARDAQVSGAEGFRALGSPSNSESSSREASAFFFLPLVLSSISTAA